MVCKKKLGLPLGTKSKKNGNSQSVVLESVQHSKDPMKTNQTQGSNADTLPSVMEDVEGRGGLAWGSREGDHTMQR